MIRMSSNQFMSNYMLQLQRAYNNQAKLFEQGDGGKLHRPSDNAIEYHKLLRYQVSLNENEQYQQDVKAGNSWMSTSDGALKQIVDIMQTFVEKTTAAANDHNNESNWDEIGKEMLALVQQAVSTANQQEGDRYVFSGLRDLIKPFELSTDLKTRGLAKTLDNSQINFFRSADNTKNVDTHSTLTQMLTLKVQGDEQATDKLYYLDTKSGYIYDKQFMDEGYKDKYANGKQLTPAEFDADGNFVRLVDAVAKLDDSYWDTDADGNTVLNFKVSDYFDSRGIIYDTPTETTTYTDADGKYIKFVTKNNGETYTYNDKTYTRATNTVGDVTYTTYTQVGTNPPITITFMQDASGEITRKGYEGVTYTSATTTNEALNITWRSGEADKQLEFQTIQQYIVDYKGDPNHISMVKLNGRIDPTSDTVNLTGQEMFGSDIFDDEFSGNSRLDIDGNLVSSGSAMLNEMLTVLAKTQQHDSSWMTSDGMTVSDVAHATLIVGETQMGARHQLYESVLTMLENHNDDIVENITDVSSADVAELAIKLMEMQTLYNMSLSMGARILPQSLADYL